MVAVLLDDLHPSHIMSHMSFPAVVHMHDSLYLHAQQIDKMRSIGLLVSLPSSACIYILHVDAHKLDICSTIVHLHNSMGLVLLIKYNFRNQGN